MSRFLSNRLAPWVDPRVKRVKVADVKAYFSETVEAYVRRRHAELKDKNRKNDEIWPLLAAELGARNFGAPVLTQRQLRRMVYG